MLTPRRVFVRNLGATFDPLPARAWSKSRPPTVHHRCRSLGRPVCAPCHDVRQLPWLPDKDGQPNPDVEEALVCVRPDKTLSVVLRRQVGVASAWRHLLPGDRGCVCWPPSPGEESDSAADVLRQDIRPDVLPCGAESRRDAHMDRCYIHWCRRLPAVRLNWHSNDCCLFLVLGGHWGRRTRWLGIRTNWHRRFIMPLLKQIPLMPSGTRKMWIHWL